MKNMYYFLLVLLLSSCTFCEDEGTVPVPEGQSEIRFSDAKNGGGCSDLMVYHYSDDRRYGVLLSGDRDRLSLSSEWQSYAADADGLSVELYQFSEPVYAYFCDDVNEEYEQPIGTWTAQSGTVRLRISSGFSTTNSLYAVDVIMEDIVANRTALPKIELDEVSVGWLPG